jgi:hypothetical protein
VRRLRDAIGVGFREWRTVALLLAANWLVAALMVAPAVPVLSDAFGHAPLAVGKPLISTELLLGMSRVFANGGMPSVLAPLILAVLLQLFLVGGVVWRACAGGPFRLGAFLGQSGRLVGRNARLYLWLLLLLGLALLVPIGLAALLHALGLPTVFTLPREAWIFGRPFTVVSVLHLAVLVLALALWRLCLEVGRVLLFREDLRVTRAAAWRAVTLVVRAPGSLALYAVLGGLATLAVLVLVRGRAMLPEGSTGVALLALALGQVVVWTRLAFQVAGTRFAAGLVESVVVAVPAVEHLTESAEASRTV